MYITADCCRLSKRSGPFSSASILDPVLPLVIDDAQLNGFLFDRRSSRFCLREVWSRSCLQRKLLLWYVFGYRYFGQGPILLAFALPLPYGALPPPLLPSLVSTVF